jgi:hypothetical protein
MTKVICSFLIPKPTATSLELPQSKPGCSILLTAFSSSTISVSSSQGLTSIVTTDFAIVLAFFDFFSLYSARRCCLILSASASSSSSSEPKRSISSSSPPAAAAVEEPVRKALPPSLEPERFANSDLYDLMWLYQRSALRVVGGVWMALKTSTSACEGVYLDQKGYFYVQGIS